MTRPAATPRRAQPLPDARRRSLPVLVIGALLAGALCAGLFALGIWQVHRMAWKHALIERVDSRIHAPPVPVPSPPQWPAVSEDHDGYRRVEGHGHFLHDRETLVQAVTELGSGYWVLTPFVTDKGFTVLVNRGFVPSEKRDPKSRTAGNPPGETDIIGLMRMSEPKGGFLRNNDPAHDRWYSRDVAAIARARQLGRIAPFFIDAGPAANPGGYPVGGLTVVKFRDSHLSYAITWFTLSAMVAAAMLFTGWHEWKLRRATRA